MKHLLKTVLPAALVERVRRFRSLRLEAALARRNAGLSNREVFSSIYANNLWGGKRGQFCSGTGSSSQHVVDRYVEVVADFLDRSRPPTGAKHVVVDLGCGDFRVGSRLVSHASQYVAVDVVPALVEHLRQTVKISGVDFQCLDICQGLLPPGDVCLVRQVLQHLSNAQIAAILPKLLAYRWVIVTEHVPAPGEPVLPNLDKPPGSSIRLTRNSGVYLQQPPFSIPPASMTTLLEVPAAEDRARVEGVIRTECIDVARWRADATV